MPGSLTSFFGEPEDFQAALSGQGVLELLIVGRGQFRARLTQISLHRLQLAAGEEELSRIAFITVPAAMVLLAFPIGGRPPPAWGGVEVGAGEIITLGPGERLHARTAGPCSWGAIHASAKDLVEYGRALSGAGFVVPPAARWRPPPAALRDFRYFYRAAIRMAEARSGALGDIEAVHGLEQQLIDALVECLSAGSAQEETLASRRRRAILARFEDLLLAEPFPRKTDICAALGVSERTLRECCKNHLDMSPSRYGRLRRMQQVHRALRSGTLDTASVSEVARRYGFRDLGRFAGSYCALYGELPSVTLRRGPLRGLAELTLGRPRVKFS